MRSQEDWSWGWGCPSSWPGLVFSNAAMVGFYRAHWLTVVESEGVVLRE